MYQHDWEIVERLRKNERDRQYMTSSERQFIDDLHRRGMRSRLSQKQVAWLDRIAMKVALDPELVRLELNSALARLKTARSPKELQVHMVEVIELRCSLLRTLDPEAVPVVAHNLAEQLYYTLLKEIKPCSTKF